MNRKCRGVTRESISPYLTRLAAKKPLEVDIFTTEMATSTTTKSNMAGTDTSTPSGVTSTPSEVTKDVSNAEVLKMIVEMRTELGLKMDTGFDKLENSIQKLTDRVESVELDVKLVRDEQERDRERIDNLEDNLKEVQRSLLHTQLYARKYHLLIHGQPGFETDVQSTIEVVRKFAKGPLGMSATQADEMCIRNAHRLQRRSTGETPIIVVFLKWHERDAFLKAGRNLMGTGKRVTPDLPPALKKLRGALSHEAYKIRQNEKMQARIKSRDVDFWIEVRRDHTDQWKKREVNIEA